MLKSEYANKHTGPSLHLVWSCFVTNKRLRVYNFNQTPNYEQDRILSFKTTLKSLSLLPLTSFSLFLKLDEEFEFAKNEIIEFVENNFSNAVIYSHRLETFEQWKKQFFEVKCDYILWLTYDDHAFVSDSNSEFSNLLIQLKEADSRYPDQIIYGQLSHYPEMISGFEYFSMIKKLQKVNDYNLIPCQVPLGAVLVNTIKLRAAWTIDFTEGNLIVSPENPFGPSFTTPTGLGLIPKTEILRHLDGYQHVSIQDPYEKVNYFPGQREVNIDGYVFRFLDIYDKNTIKSPLSFMRCANSAKSRQLDICTNRLILANARRISLLGSTYALSSVDTSKLIKNLAFWKSLILHKTLRKNFLYIPIDLVVLLILKLIYVVNLSKKNHEKLLTITNGIVSYRLIKYLGIKTSFREKISVSKFKHKLCRYFLK